MSGDPQLNAVTLAISQAVNNINSTINSKFPDWVAVPATHTSSGIAGQVSYDSTHFYICIGPSSWARVAIASW